MRAQTWRSLTQRIIAVVAAGAVAAGLLVTMNADFASASTVTLGHIQSATGPLTHIALSATNQQQVGRSDLLATGAVRPGANLNDPSGSELKIYPMGSTDAYTTMNHQQAFLGNGSIAAPFKLESFSDLAKNGVETGLRLSETVSYVEGSNYYRTDLEISNFSSEAVSLNVMRYLACDLADGGLGYGSLVSQSAQCFTPTANLSMYALTGGYSFAAGDATAVHARVSGAVSLKDQCLGQAGSVLTQPLCMTTQQDIAIAMQHANQNIPRFGRVTISHYTALQPKAPQTTNLIVTNNTTDETELGISYEIPQEITIKNPGSITATNIRVQLNTNTQLRLQSASVDKGTFDEQLQLWNIPSLAPGQSAKVQVTYYAMYPGGPKLGVDGIMFDQMDLSPCETGANTYCGAQPAPLLLDINQKNSTYQVTTGPQPADNVAAHTITVYLAARNGQPLGDQGSRLKVVTTPANGVTVGPFVESTTDKGYYTATVTSTVAGEKDIIVTADIEGVDTELEIFEGLDKALFVAGKPVLGFSSAVIDDQLQRVADGNQAHELTVTLQDAYQNPVLNAQQLIRVDQPGALIVSDFTAAAVPGQYTALLRSTQAGSHPTNVVFDNTLTFPVLYANFKAGEPDLNNAGTLVRLVTANPKTVTDPATATSAMTASVHRVEAQVRDAFGNPIAGREVHFIIPSGVSVLQNGPDLVKTDANGVASISLVASKAQTYQVSAELAGSLIRNGDPVSLTFVADTADAGKFVQFTGTPGGVEANNIATHSVTAVVVDRFDNPIPDVAVSFTLPGVVNLVSGRLATTTDPAGRAVVTVSSAVAGTYSIAGQVNGVPQSANILFVAGAPSALNSSWRVITPGPQPAGASYTAEVTIRDALGNVVPNAPISFAQDQGLAINETGVLKTDAAGQVTASFTATRAGTYELRALIGSDQIGAPASLVFTNAAPDVDAALSRLDLTSDAPIQVADGVAEHRVTAYLVDRFGNPVTNATVTFAVSPDVQVAAGGSLSVATNSAGTATIRLVSTKAASSTVTATIDGASAIKNGSPVTVTFKAGVPVAARSLFTVDPAGPLIVGTEAANTYTATMTALDAFDNPVPQVQLLLTSEPALRQSTLGGVTDADGKVVVTLTSTLAGTFLLSPKIILDQEESPFGTPVSRVYLHDVPDLAADGKSTVRTSVGVRLANDEDTHQVIASVRDKYDNPVPNQSVVVQLPQALHISGATTQTTNANGEVTFTFTSHDADTYTVPVYVGTISGANQIRNGAPAQIRFDTGPADATFSQLNVIRNAGKTLTVGIGAESTFDVQVLVRDQYGNAVPGEYVQLLVKNAAGAVVYDMPVLTMERENSDRFGELLASIHSIVAGEFTIEALVNATPITGSGAPLAWKSSTPEANTSLFTLTDGKRQADGVAAHTATVQLRDQYGNNVAQTRPVRFVVESPASGSADTTTSADGLATTSITSTKAGTFEVYAEFEGATVAPGAGWVLFTDKPDAPVVHLSNGTVISGQGEVGNTITVTLPNGTQLTTQVDENGEWSITVAPGVLAHRDPLTATQTRPDGATSPEGSNIVFKPAPTKPDPTNGKTLTGTAEPNAFLVFTNEQNQVIGTTTAREDGSFTVQLSPRAKWGETVTIDAAIDGIYIDTTAVTVNTPRLLVKHPSRYAGETQTVNGSGFMPGETVNAYYADDTQVLASKPADSNGNVTFTFTVRKSESVGTIPIRLDGVKSGDLSGGFELLLQSDSGSNGGQDPTAGTNASGTVTGNTQASSNANGALNGNAASTGNDPNAAAANSANANAASNATAASGNSNASVTGGSAGAADAAGDLSGNASAATNGWSTPDSGNAGSAGAGAGAGSGAAGAGLGDAAAGGAGNGTKSALSKTGTETGWLWLLVGALSAAGLLSQRFGTRRLTPRPSR